MATKQELRERKEKAIACQLKRLLNCDCESVTQAYKTPSTRKIGIEGYILNEMRGLNGWGYRVLSHNGFIFTCGYLCEMADQETGEITVHMIIHTPTRRDDIDVTRFMYPYDASTWFMNDYGCTLASSDWYYN